MHDMKLLTEVKENYDVVNMMFIICIDRGFVFEPLDYLDFDSSDAERWMNKEMARKAGAKTIKQARSMIHPQYANRFIRQYIL